MSVGFRKMLISAQGDGSAITAAAATSALPAQAKKTIQANFFENVGQQLIIRATGRISCVITTPGTARFDVRLGGTVIFDGLAVPLNTTAQTNVPFELEIILTLRAAGSSANFMGFGKFISRAVVGSAAAGSGGVGAELLPYNSAPAVGGNFDATAAQQLDLFFTQTVTTGSMTLHQFSAEAPTFE